VAIIKKPKYGVSLGNSFAQARIGYHFKVDEMLKDERSLAILAARNGLPCLNRGRSRTKPGRMAGKLSV